ncbi:carbon-nitrogen hydrolase family protein [candidate division KSB1 bacterium]|nr:carbon-nitrogen hydrolase family protein [candidate division KSB1 bacterium]
MNDIKITVATLKSILRNPMENLQRVKHACERAKQDSARILFLPELMLTGHGGHPIMAENAEAVPDGPLSSEILKLSAAYELCICVGIAEREHNIAYNSQIVMDKGQYLGLQRKIHLSGDEYCHFGAGEKVAVFDIGDIRFGITICYDNHFPELALIHALNHVDLILAPHAARSGVWSAPITREFSMNLIKLQQENWEKVHRARAFDHNIFVLLNNVVGSATEGLENVVANHAGTVMGVDPNGDVFLRTTKSDFEEEIVTVELQGSRRKFNHNMTRNRKPHLFFKMLQETLYK